MDADGAEARAVAEFHNRDSVLCYDSRTQLHRLLLGTLPGRALIAGIAIKALAFFIGRLPAPVSLSHDLVDTVGDICLLAGGAIVAFRVWTVARARLLWRVRRKLILSYIFIGVVPALLIITFFLLSGLLLLFSVSSYLIQSRVRALVQETRYLADKAALDRSVALATAAPYPGTRYAFVTDSRCTGTPTGALPEWMPCAGFAGLVAQATGMPLVVRAVSPPAAASDTWTIVDVPISETITHRLRDETGIEVGDIGVLGDDGGAPRFESATRQLGGLRWVTFLDYTDWQTGSLGTATVAIQLIVADIYDRISATPIAPIGNMNFGQLLLFGLALVGASFLIIQVVAFGMGFGLARSITGSVHALFAGTERVRRGDFTNKIPIRSRDQLGELAESFNSMTASIEDLLRQKAEKERLEQELRTAREIQMSLLPTGPLQVPGLLISAHCEPAREVGGDYYDLLPLPDGCHGVLIADVSGKGTSAALYMAQLKGLILSLSQLHLSPRQLLIAANRILSEHLDDRSFITMTYAVADPRARTLTCARAGHCPLIHRAGGGQETRILAPDGLVLGLKIDTGGLFERLLEEVTMPLTEDDVFFLFTDGLSEAMNLEGECFGESRLAAIVAEHGDSTPDLLRDRVLREVHNFTGPAAQHDDMTMLIIKVQ